MANLQFDLEKYIMQCWGVVDDLDVLFGAVCDSSLPLTEDQIANTLLGMKQLYNMKFYALMSTFEKYLKEQHEERKQVPETYSMRGMRQQ